MKTAPWEARGDGRYDARPIAKLHHYKLGKLLNSYRGYVPSEAWDQFSYELWAWQEAQQQLRDKLHCAFPGVEFDLGPCTSAPEDPEPQFFVGWRDGPSESAAHAAVSGGPYLLRAMRVQRCVHCNSLTPSSSTHCRECGKDVVASAATASNNPK